MGERSNRREKMVARTLSSLLLLLSCVQLAFCNGGVCTTASPCDEAQGDCDTDEECNNGLVCGIDNLKSIHKSTTAQYSSNCHHSLLTCSAANWRNSHPMRRACHKILVNPI